MRSGAVRIQKVVGVVGAAVVLVIGMTATTRAWDTNAYSIHYNDAFTETDQVPETSGVVVSRRVADLYWTHNDGGHLPRVYAFRLNTQDSVADVAKDLGYVELTGAVNIDWEDIAAGPGPYLYVFDGGDNPPCDRDDKRIYRITEPIVDPDGAPVALSQTPTSVRFEYPDPANPLLPASRDDDRYDAESFAVHPVTGDMYIATKRDNGGMLVTRLYRIPAAGLVWDSTTIRVAEYLGDITATVPYLATAMDIDKDGHRVVIRDLLNAFEFTVPPGGPFEAAFAQTPAVISLSGENQGEAITYDFAGGDLLTTSEYCEDCLHRFPIFRVPWVMANLRATDVGRQTATIRWDTRAALASRVDYGETTAYGSIVTDSTLVADHAVVLSGLMPGRRYYYRAQSGASSAPSAARASAFYFDTPPPAAPVDADYDDDVDLADFVVFQLCFNGPQRPPGLPSGCDRVDPDQDGDVDLVDFAVFLACFNGADRPVACN